MNQYGIPSYPPAAFNPHTPLQPLAVEYDFPPEFSGRPSTGGSVPIPNLPLSEYVLPAFESTSPVASASITLTNPENVIEQDGIVTGITHFTHVLRHHHAYGTIGLHNASLWLFCEVAHYSPASTSTTLFASDNTVPFRLPLRPSQVQAGSRNIEHSFSFALPSNLPHSHTFLAAPHLPRTHAYNAPVMVEIRYRLLLTCIVHQNQSRYPATEAENTLPQTVFAWAPLTLAFTPRVKRAAYLGVDDTRTLALAQRKPQATWAAARSDHAVAVALSSGFASMGNPFPVCVTARVPGSTAVRAEVCLTEHVVVDGTPLLKVKRIGARGASGMVGIDGVATIRFEVEPRSSRMYPTAKIGGLAVAHGVEARVIAWCGPGDSIWREVPEREMAVSVPVVLLPTSDIFWRQT